MKPEKIRNSNLEIDYFPGFFPAKKAEDYLQDLLKTIPWKQEKILLFGRERLQPRLSAFFGNPERDYTYSGLRLTPLPYPQKILEIKQLAEEALGESFNSCLANLYRDGQDSMGWHSDDEKELGKNPVIASVSFGSKRIFHFKHKKEERRHKIILRHGSLLLMKGETQHFWKHQLPKTRKPVPPRINLTFRQIKKHS